MLNYVSHQRSVKFTHILHFSLAFLTNTTFASQLG